MNEKVVLANGDPVPVVLLANKVCPKEFFGACAKAGVPSRLHIHTHTHTHTHAHTRTHTHTFPLCPPSPTQCDSYDEGSYQTIEAFCKDRGFRSWFPTSAKTGKNISESVDFLAKEILRVAADNYPRPDEEGTKLVSNAPAVGKPMTLDEFKSKCCA